jgi:hypothetical protein
MSKLEDISVKDIFVINIIKKNKKEKNIIYVPNIQSKSPHFPNFPPQNTPPDIESFRSLYLSYLAKIK